MRFCDYLREKIDFFISTNDKGDVHDATLWESIKTVLRGNIIAYEAAERRQEKGKLKDALAQLEKEYRATQNAETLSKIIKLKYEYNAFMSKNVLKMLNQVKQKYFELGDKPQKLFAR